MQNIAVSINCITYNHEKYIRKAIESFLMQKTSFEYEIIIGEDCSSDGTKGIIMEYVEKYPEKIRIITSDNNVGARENARRIFHASNGKYIAVCEGDDYWIDPYKLQKQFDYMENNLECGLVFSNVKYLNDKTKKIKINKVLEEKKFYLEDVILNGGGFIPTCTIMYRKYLMNKPPRFYKEASIGDYPLQIICSLYGHVYCLRDFTAIYRVDVNNSWTNKELKNMNKSKLISSKKKIIDVLDMFNNYTDNKYINIINKAKLPLEFDIYILNSKRIRYRKIKESKYGEYFDNMNIKEKISILIKGNFSDIYISLNNIKRNIKWNIKKIIEVVKQ